MKLIRKLSNRLKALFLNGKLESELDDEIRFHLEMEIEKNVGKGMSLREARRAAAISFGGVELLKEECRDSWGVRVFADLVRDLRYSVKALWKSKGFSLSVVVTLTLCIGVNMTIMSALYDMVLKPLPFRESDRLYQVVNIEEQGASKSNSAWSQYSDFKEKADLFEGFAFLYEVQKPMEESEGGILARGQSMSADFLTLMGVKPILGRFFLPDENTSGNHRVAILPQSVWENVYESDIDIVGKPLRFAGEPSYEIIGVAPKSVEIFDTEARFFIPFRATNVNLDPQNRYLWPIDLWAKLKKGVSLDAGLAQLKSLERDWLENMANPQRYARNEKRIDRIDLRRVAPLGESLWLLQIGAVVALAIGLVNVINLFLSRAIRRSHELSVRHELGAGAVPLARLLVMEGFGLSFIGLILGLLMSFVSIDVINRYLTVIDPSIPRVAYSSPVLFAAVLIATGIALVVGVLPLALLWKLGYIRRIDNSSRSSTDSGRIGLIRKLLIVGQVASAFVLLTGAGLLVKSFKNIMDTDPGFDAAGVIKARVHLRGLYPKNEIAGVRARIINSLEEIPGVESVSWAHFESFNVDHKRHPFYIRGQKTKNGKGEILVRQTVDHEYFRTMGIPLMEGRFVEPGESGYIVDAPFASRNFPNATAVGAEIYHDPSGPPSGVWPRIQGVIARTNLEGLEARDGQPVIYSVEGPSYGAWAFTVLLRTDRKIASIGPEIRARIREVGPAIPVSELETLEKALDDLLVDRRGITYLLVCFAGLALLLSSVGINGVISYDVERRQREIGIRRAVGATRGEVLAMVLREGLARALYGIGLGILGALFLNRFLESRLFDVAALDFAIYTIAIVFLLVIALVANYLPARRAANIDSLEALRVK